MKIKLILAAALFTFFMSVNAYSQKDIPESIEEYIDTAKTIIIAKCLHNEPVMRSGIVRIEVEILHVLKGKETDKKVTVTTIFQNMDEGANYLLRTENAQKSDENYFRIDSIISMVALSPYENIEELKKLPLKTAVARIMNSRKTNIDIKIQRLSGERNALEEFLKEQ